MTAWSGGAAHDRPSFANAIFDNYEILELTLISIKK